MYIYGVFSTRCLFRCKMLISCVMVKNSDPILNAAPVFFGNDFQHIMDGTDLPLGKKSSQLIKVQEFLLVTFEPGRNPPTFRYTGCTLPYFPEKLVV